MIPIHLIHQHDEIDGWLEQGDSAPAVFAFARLPKEDVASYWEWFATKANLLKHLGRSDDGFGIVLDGFKAFPMEPAAVFRAAAEIVQKDFDEAAFLFIETYYPEAKETWMSALVIANFTATAGKRDRAKHWLEVAFQEIRHKPTLVEVVKRNEVLLPIAVEMAAEAQKKAN
jgi:hypothetical protein